MLTLLSKLGVELSCFGGYGGGGGRGGGGGGGGGRRGGEGEGEGEGAGMMENEIERWGDKIDFSLFFK